MAKVFLSLLSNNSVHLEFQIDGSRKVQFSSVRLCPLPGQPVMCIDMQKWKLGNARSSGSEYLRIARQVRKSLETRVDDILSEFLD